MSNGTKQGEGRCELCTSADKAACPASEHTTSRTPRSDALAQFRQRTSARVGVDEE